MCLMCECGKLHKCGILIMLFWLCASSCQYPNPGEAIVRIPSNELKNFYPIQVDDQIILTSDCDGVPCLISIDINKRKKKWQWLDANDELKDSYHNITPYSHGNFLAIPIGNSVKVFDVAKGRLIHDILFENSSVEPYLSGIADAAIAVFYSEDRDGIRKAVTTGIDLVTGNKEELYHDIFPTSNIFKSMPPVTVKDGIYIYSILTYNKDSGGTSYLIRFDSEKDIKDTLIAYEQNEFGFGIARPAIQDKDEGFSYWQTTDGVIKLNNRSFEIEWNCQVGSVILTSEIYCFEDKIIYPAENQSFFFIDINDGSISDIVKDTPGTPGKLFNNDNIIYFIGGADEYLYRWDYINSTQFDIFKLIQDDSEGKFKRQIFVDERIFILLMDQHWLISNDEALLEHLSAVE